MTPVLLIDFAYAGSSFETLSKVTNVVKLDSQSKVDRIAEQIRVARAKSAHALTRDEIEKIMIQAQQAVEDQKGMIIQTGASVFCGSQVVE